MHTNYQIEVRKLKHTIIVLINRLCIRAVEVTVKKPRFFRFLNLKNLKSPNFRFLGFCFLKIIIVFLITLSLIYTLELKLNNLNNIE